MTWTWWQIVILVLVICLTIDNIVLNICKTILKKKDGDGDG